jgi:hypothetical protein
VNGLLERGARNFFMFGILCVVVWACLGLSQAFSIPIPCVLWTSRRWSTRAERGGGRGVVITASAAAQDEMSHGNQTKGDNSVLGTTHDRLFQERFRRQKAALERQITVERSKRPPNAALTAQETVRSILDGLRRPHYPTRYFGLMVLLHSSSEDWSRFLRQTVGASVDESSEAVAAALEAALGRPHNQFQILLGLENEGYTMEFPNDPLDYGDDDACWLECRLRDGASQDLLVVLGWSLVKQQISSSPSTVSSAWVVDGLEWQDFRDSYRPGIGREEWERICG